MSASQAISVAGGFVFAFAVFHLLPGMPHKGSLFKIAGWLITSGWLLQQWESSGRSCGMRRKLVLLLRTSDPLRKAAREHFVPELLWAAALTTTAFIALASRVQW
jgi:hypothetical protein